MMSIVNQLQDQVTFLMSRKEGVLFDLLKGPNLVGTDTRLNDWSFQLLVSKQIADVLSWHDASNVMIRASNVNKYVQATSIFPLYVSLHYHSLFSSSKARAELPSLIHHLSLLFCYLMLRYPVCDWEMQKPLLLLSVMFFLFSHC